MSDSSLRIFSFSGSSRILHLTWFAFFLSFLVWFNSAPLMISIRETFNLSTDEVKALLTLNVALTIPGKSTLLSRVRASTIRWMTGGGCN